MHSAPVRHRQQSGRNPEWDIRPKPEFGTIELRVMETPLTVERAAQIAAYTQALARYLQEEEPVEPHEDDYLVYTFNRFQACRLGYDGTLVIPDSAEQRIIRDDRAHRDACL